MSFRVFSCLFLVVALFIGCQQPIQSPTPIYVGLSGQLKQSLMKKNAAVVALAKSLENVSDDALMRKTWNDGFKAIEDTYAAESSTALKGAILSAVDAKGKTALWQEVEKAYAP